MADTEAQVLVQDHGDFVSALFPDGVSQTLSWRDLVRFEIHTNDSGPWGWDVWFALVGNKESVSFPLGATGQEAALEKLQAVTGKDRGQLIDGMNCTENRTFVTWERQ